ncbi:MAG: zinc metallopeptidase [Lachnospiraceae bacterium]|nr:zinc metallopeptidase [Lachnospiraceae bacterium]MDD6182239.1 zinc metallopeptidase [Lachnospiraceae bacterium]MDD7378467.1 zinc metallopeptidase [Lachnospiraceae bacterium]MDY4616463.1 zinc metallopeptidase [Lachnospiraceae bacterium]MDY5775055.1 zinc metallopeptidase [Lachnospiraceae bacterium]
MYYWWDQTYILVIIGAIICLIASARVKTTYAKYSKDRSMSGMTGAEAAERILRNAGIHDVSIGHVSGNLTDHYNPKTKVLNLSDSVYGSTSVAAIGVAAHECGHAIQHQEGYFPLSFRGALVPVANFGSTMAWPLIIIGLFFNSHTGTFLIQLGIMFFSLAVLFQLVTLPVEFNASNRAVHILGSTGMLQDDELKKTRRVLRAAALTYVASAAAAILQLLRLVLLFGGRDD